MMNHQPFETWLLSPEPLSPDQGQALQAHLSSCETCRRLSANWPEVQQLFRAVPTRSPASGFTARWQARLAASRMEEHLRQQRRQSWWMLLITGGLAAYFLVLLVAQVALVYESPQQLLFAGAFRLAEVLATANLVQKLLLTLPSFFIDIIPPFWWAVFAALLGLLCLIWILSLGRLIIPRRVTQ